MKNMLFNRNPLRQIEKIKVGEAGYINGLTGSNGKKYQSYINFDKKIGKVEFSFNNPNKQQNPIKKISIKSKGKKI